MDLDDLWGLVIGLWVVGSFVLRVRKAMRQKETTPATQETELDDTTDPAIVYEYSSEDAAGAPSRRLPVPDPYSDVPAAPSRRQIAAKALEQVFAEMGIPTGMTTKAVLDSRLQALMGGESPSAKQAPPPPNPPREHVEHRVVTYDDQVRGQAERRRPRHRHVSDSAYAIRPEKRGVSAVVVDDAILLHTILTQRR